MRLTKDEMMMAVIYGDGTRGGLLKSLMEMRSALQADERELMSMTDGFLLKLREMTDSEYEEAVNGE